VEILNEFPKAYCNVDRITPISAFETSDTDIIFRINEPVTFKYDIAILHD